MGGAIKPATTFAEVPMMSSSEKIDFIPSIRENKARNQIEDQIAAFLKKGGEIQQIPNGISTAQHNVYRQQISLGTRDSKKKK
jgi:hypothetical protein